MCGATGVSMSIIKGLANMKNNHNASPILDGYVKFEYCFKNRLFKHRIFYNRNSISNIKFP